MTDHPLECPCSHCELRVASLRDRIIREQQAIAAHRARRAARLTAQAEKRRRVTIAAYEAGLLYEWARGQLRLRKAAHYAAKFHDVPEHAVHAAVQRTHGQVFRGKPRREQSAARRAA